MIALGLMGGGAVAAAVLTPNVNRNRECQTAREQNLPNADEICRRSSSSSGGARSSWHSGSTGIGRVAGAAVGAAIGSAVTTSASRGGFGGSGAAHSSGGG